MIENRPASLLADPTYSILPNLPIALDWSSIPELIRVATLDLGGVQPLTQAMVDAAGGTLHDKPSDGEVSIPTTPSTPVRWQSVAVIVTLSGMISEGSGIGARI